MFNFGVNTHKAVRAGDKNQKLKQTRIDSWSSNRSEWTQ